MKKIEYTLEGGRVIAKNGKLVLSLNRVGSDKIGYTLSPSDADIFAHRIVNALNHLELIRQRGGI